MTTNTHTRVERYTISVPEATLTDLHDRLARTRWTDQEAGAGWGQGTDRAYLKELVAYWTDGFDWRAQEASLNRFPQVMVDVEGTKVHAIHARGTGPEPFPLLLLHGWPDSFWRMTKIVPLLADPGAHGGDPADAFEVVVPSIPGFGFSERPAVKTDRRWTAARMAGLMAALGYDRYGVHGGDVGSGLAEWLGQTFPGAVAGLHLTDVPYWHLFTDVPDDLSEAERAFIEAGQQWGMTEGAYAMLQSTRPQSAAVGLNDSPAGLAAWIVEKFRAWSDCGGDLEARFSKDDLLTNLTIYWVTETIGSSFRHYVHARPPEATGKPPMPAGFAIFPRDIVPAPREWAERRFDVQRWTEMPRGGHFAAWEEPELLAEEIRAFFRELR